MIVHTVTDPPSPELASALMTFEEQFTYPLGTTGSFRISHGPDYARFYRAMGETAVFVAEHDGQVLGTLAGALRRLVAPSGNEQLVGYVGDLKILPSARGGLSLLYLARALQTANAGRTRSAFAVVMDGTVVLPQAYSGRLGIPAFAELARIAVLHVSTAGDPGDDDSPSLRTTATAAAPCHRRWNQGRYAVLAGDPTRRSEFEPTWLMLPDASACGLVEDTRRAKRLITDVGEMRSIHLSNFAYRGPADGAALIRVTMRLAARNGYPVLFVAVPAADAAAFRRELSLLEPDVATATVYGYGLQPGIAWSVNTAEI